MSSTIWKSSPSSFATARPDLVRRRGEPRRPQRHRHRQRRRGLPVFEPVHDRRGRRPPAPSCRGTRPPIIPSVAADELARDVGGRIPGARAGTLPRAARRRRARPFPRRNGPHARACPRRSSSSSSRGQVIMDEAKVVHELDRERGGASPARAARQGFADGERDGPAARACRRPRARTAPTSACPCSSGQSSEPVELLVDERAQLVRTVRASVSASRFARSSSSSTAFASSDSSPRISSARSGEALVVRRQPVELGRAVSSRVSSSSALRQGIVGDRRLLSSRSHPSIPFTDRRRVVGCVHASRASPPRRGRPRAGRRPASSSSSATRRMFAFDRAEPISRPIVGGGGDARVEGRARGPRQLGDCPRVLVDVARRGGSRAACPGDVRLVEDEHRGAAGPRGDYRSLEELLDGDVDGVDGDVAAVRTTARDLALHTSRATSGRTRPYVTESSRSARAWPSAIVERQPCAAASAGGALDFPSTARRTSCDRAPPRSTHRADRRDARRGSSHSPAPGGSATSSSRNDVEWTPLRNSSSREDVAEAPRASSARLRSRAPRARGLRGRSRRGSASLTITFAMSESYVGGITEPSSTKVSTRTSGPSGSWKRVDSARAPAANPRVRVFGVDPGLDGVPAVRRASEGGSGLPGGDRGAAHADEVDAGDHLGDRDARPGAARSPRGTSTAVGVDEELAGGGAS